MKLLLGNNELIAAENVRLNSGEVALSGKASSSISLNGCGVGHGTSNLPISKSHQHCP